MVPVKMPVSFLINTAVNPVNLKKEFLPVISSLTVSFLASSRNVDDSLNSPTVLFGGY